MKITFLGTSQAIPTATRNHTSILLNYKDENILVDCGEGTQRQFRKAKLNPQKLTRLLITHWHGDHVLGIPGLLQTLMLNNYSKTLHIYGPRGTKKYMRQIFNIFVKEGKIKLKVFEVSGKFINTDDFTITAIKLDHGAPCNGYEFKEKDRLRIKKDKLKKLKLDNKDKMKLSQLTKGKNVRVKGKTLNAKSMTYKKEGKKISFIFDTKLSKNVSKLAKDSDIAIIESTYTNAEKNLAKDYKHMTAEQAAKVAKSNKVKKLYLTHISQRYEHKEDIILKEAKKFFKDTTIAEDLMSFEL